ncbi:MAG: DUF6079 family protein [Bacillota bacterium]
MKKIKNLIEIPEVKTVIQLSDINDPDLRNFLMESFLLTEEVKNVLVSFFRSVSKKEGKGFFLEGNFGSGKSHLLTVISLLFSSEKSWEPLIEQDDSNLLKEFQKDVTTQEYKTVNISLVEHSSTERLEEIVNEAIGNQFSSTFAQEDFKLGAENYRRKNFYQVLDDRLSSAQYGGLVILIDELSEFLRSKPDGRSFNEDIRYLQFMGEFIQGKNCWLMATLQEAIEKTGEITQEIFGKIKDRYPVHFHLTGTHIRKIVANRLIRKKPGAEKEIKNVYQKYSTSFSGWPVSQEEFIKIYPVNPLAISLLDNLKPLFSQHRGIIDFIHHHIKGDQSRNIEGMMDKPIDMLLNPDLIFDHFLDRLRERMETRQYYEKVFRYYEQEIGSILPQEDIQTGLRIIKLLILFAVSPVEKEYRVQDIVHMLLKPVTDLDPEVNYEYIEDILKKMYRHGAYLVRQEGENTKENVYQLNLEADVNRIIKEKTGFIQSNFFVDEERIFTKVGKLVDESSLPLARLLEAPRSVRRINWQKTQRSGYFCLLPFYDITLKSISEFKQRLQGGQINIEEELKDFVIFLGYPLQTEKQKTHLNEVILPEIDQDLRAGFCFWLPAEVKKEGYLRKVLARLLLYEEYQEKSGETAEDVIEKLDELLQEDKVEVSRIFREIFGEGFLLDGNGEKILSLKKTGPTSFDKIIQNIAGKILENRYPDHVKIAPYQSVINKSQLNRLCNHFLEKGVIKEDDARKIGLINVINDVLKPLGIIKQQGQNIRLKLKPGSNPLLKSFFRYLEQEKTDINSVFLALRRGKYGLSKSHFKILTLVLLYGGYITAYSEQKKISLKQLNVYNFERIKFLGQGEIVDEDFQKILQSCTIFPPRFRDQPFSLPLQQEMWTYITDWKREKEEEFKNLQTLIKTRAPENGFSFLTEEELIKNLEKVNNLLAEIMVSYSAEEGLERFASTYRNIPNLDLYRKRWQQIKQFFTEKYNKYREIKNYLDNMPQLPEDEYKEIVGIKKELRASLQDRDIIFTDGFLENLWQKFREFRSQYSEKYYSEHQKVLSRKRFAQYHKIKESRSYRVLSYLADLEMISVKDDLIKVDRQLARVQRKECSQLNQDQLLRNPVCSCGFKPGSRPETVPVKEIHNLISRGLSSYLQKLTEPEFKSQIEDYLASMEEVGKKRFARPIRNLLKIANKVKEKPLRSETIKELEKILNRNVINRINQALAGRINLLERDLDLLYENLVGRSFAPEQIRDIFCEWLEGDDQLDKHSYVRVISQTENNTAQRNRILEDFLDRYYPDMLSKYDTLGEEKFILFSACCVWASTHNIPAAKLASVIDVNTEMINKEKLNNHIELWEKLLSVRDDELSDRTNPQKIQNILDSCLRENNITAQVLNLLNTTEIADIVAVLIKEFISFHLLQELILILIKKSEQESVFRTDRELITNLRQEAENCSSSRRSQYLLAASDYLEIQDILVAVSEVEETKVKDLDLIYTKHVSRIEYRLACFIQKAKEVNLVSQLPVQNLKDQVQKTVEKFSQKFIAEHFSRNKDDIPVRENKNESHLKQEHLRLSDLILNKFPQMSSKLSSEYYCCILMDGMRQDTREVIQQEIRKNLAMRVIKEGHLYSWLPTNTEQQINNLQNQGFTGKIISPRDYSDQKIGKKAQISRLIKFSYIDDRVHTSKEDYYGFMEEIIFHTRNKLLPFLDNLPPRTTVLLVSDHGYRINYSFSSAKKYEMSRYLHGGETPFEVIVPWSLMYFV